MSSVRKFKAKQLAELRNKSKKELLTECAELKKELHKLRVAQVSGGAPAKVANIRNTRKNIARIFTIISQITKQKVREEIKRQNQTLLPLDLRPKLTRKERLRIPNELRFKKTIRQKKLIQKYPRRKFAVIDPSLQLPKEVMQANIKTVLSEKKSSNRYRRYLQKKQQTVQLVQKRRQVKVAKKNNAKIARKAKKSAKAEQEK
eukprot:CAMPEP_0197026502 /NCGR_PEP_ID=MMETSP1384-20130603/6574_1 /TAXON_ID=29189 /ORGANISM="Ammonia sp." /LENGTH=202 /DNA_ID=CAMNT_0042455177 /DNA_START=91 /DNA_END=699 /DNA_ORIENTATION=-